MNELEQWSEINSFIRNKHHTRHDLVNFYKMMRRELSWVEFLEHLKEIRPKIYQQLKNKALRG